MPVKVPVPSLVPEKMVLSHYQASTWLAAKKRGQTQLASSLDLGCSQVNLTIEKEGVAAEDGGIALSWDQVEYICNHPRGCFAVTRQNRLEKIQQFSEETQRSYSLYPTAAAPTMLISGTLMHRIKGTDPNRDTRCKIRAIEPVAGHVLDTATGLGYTAISAAEKARQVTTIELDPVATEMARQNPWSQQLFSSEKIRRLLGDSYEVVEDLPALGFDRIIHDPPVFQMAGHLYSEKFYRRLLRVLVKGGRLFHYIGNPASRTMARTTRGVIQRLEKAGFHQVRPWPQAFGVTARK